MEEVKQLGRVYKITSPNTDKIYIGSTTKSLKERFTRHMASYKSYTNETGTQYITSFEILKFGNINIELLEELLVTKKELHKRERYFIELNKEIATNKAIPTRTDAEYRFDYKEIRAKNQLEYNIKNKDIRAKKQQEYNIRNKEMMKERRKINYEKHKEEYHLPIQCECGKIYTLNHKIRHFKTKKHLQNITINITVPIDNHDGGIININQK
jgi:hypothetical protein